MTDSRDFNAR